MAKAILHTAVINGVERTESIRKWSSLTNKSTTFLNSMMVQAQMKGIAEHKRMQYAIEQKSGERTEKNKSDTAKAKEKPAVKASVKLDRERQEIRNNQKMIFNMGSICRG
jgi:hypothetical protein